MQVFNCINSRKIKPGEYNVFSKIWSNWLFIFIEILTIGGQILLIQFGGYPIKCSPLTIQDNLIGVGIGAFSLIWGKFESL